jgi:hypothetical protein
MVRSASCASRTMRPPVLHHPSRRGEGAAPQDEGHRFVTTPESKGGLEARRFGEIIPIAPGARAERGSTRARKLLLLRFLRLLRLFRLLRFLSHSILSGFNGWKRDTRHARRRASLATSSNAIPTDSRRAAPHCHAGVIALSTAVMRFWRIFAVARRFASQNPGAPRPIAPPAPPPQS